MIFEHVTYRSFLKEVLANRVAENDSYSQRAFAQKLGFASSYLSSVLSGKKDLSTDSALRIAVRLGLGGPETHYLCLLTQYESETDAEYKSILHDQLQAINPKQKTYDLNVEAFRVLSDWYHFGILELISVKGFKLSAATASERLGISKTDAEAAIARLIQLDLLEHSPAGFIRKTKGYILANSKIPNGAIKKFHKQLLEKALKSVDDQTPTERVSSTDVFPIDSKNLNELRKLIDHFSAEVIKLSEKCKIKDQVYCVSVHGFKLTKI